MIRAFIALDIDDKIRDQLARVRKHLEREVPERALRWVRPESVHLTLKFLGDVEQQLLVKIEDTLEVCAGVVQPFSFEVRGLGSFPNQRRPRVLWVGVQEKSGELEKLQKKIEANMSDAGFERERRRFYPHLTLGRVHRRASRSDVEQIAEALNATSIEVLGSIQCSQVHLYRSDLRPTGAVYTRLASANLGGRT